MKPFNFVTSKRIIAKVFSDLGKQRSDFTMDALEWIGEAMDAIGTFSQLEIDHKITRSHSHRVKFPPDLVFVNKIYYTKQEFDETEVPNREDFKYELPYGDPDLHPAFVDEDPEHPDTVDRTEFDESFVISGGYIRTSFDEDWVLISYTSIATDDEGYPLVPESYEFQQALYWYIVYKLMESGMKHPAGINYFHAEERWLKYCTQARNQANMPSVSEMESFADWWASLLPPKAFDRRDRINAGNAVDPNNLIADTFQRYTIEQ